MIYEKDWLMRQIQAMVSTILQFLLHAALPSEKVQNEEKIYVDKIAASIKNGELCKIEDWLFANIDGTDMMWFRIAVFFYSEANKYSDSFLEENNFSREEIEFGLREVLKRFGYGELL